MCAFREVQSVVLSNIATITAQRTVSEMLHVTLLILLWVIASQMLFEPYMKSFFVHSNDPTHIRLLKVSW